MLELANKARLDKTFDKLYNLNGRIMTLRELVSKAISKKVYLQVYSDHRINLEYKIVNKTLYLIYFENNLSVSIPKIIYDTLELPERQ